VPGARARVQWIIGQLLPTKGLLLPDAAGTTHAGTVHSIVHGTADRAAAYEQARAAADAVPLAKVVMIEGGSHGIFATHYQKVGAEIEAFLLSLKR
jgi:hypothetical protein